MKDLMRWVALLALVGLGLSLYSYLHNAGLASGEFCTIGETFDCDVVNKGPYSMFLGVPVSLIGIVGYAVLFFGSLLKMRTPQDKNLTLFLFLSADIGLMFSLYLTYLEAFVLDAWCVICIASLITILSLDVLLLLRFLEERKK